MSDAPILAVKNLAVTYKTRKRDINAVLTGISGASGLREVLARLARLPMPELLMHLHSH